MLLLQALTLASIAASIVFWVWMFRRGNVGLGRYALPIALWVLFGTLDITITAKGTFGAPANEGNPLARFIFEETGFAGPVAASVLWISLWSLVVLALNRARGGAGMPHAGFLSLAVFYSVAFGHLLGFSSWLAPLCGIPAAFYGTAAAVPGLAKIIACGCALALAHCAVLALAGGRGRGAVLSPSSQV